MATEYLNPNLDTGLNDGSSPENAWQSFATWKAGTVAGNTTLIPEGEYSDVIGTFALIGSVGSEYRLNVCSGDYTTVYTESETVSGNHWAVINAAGNANGINLSSAQHFVINGLWIKNATSHAVAGAGTSFYANIGALKCTNNAGGGMYLGNALRFSTVGTLICANNASIDLYGNTDLRCMRFVSLN